MSQPRSTNPSMRRVRRRLAALVLGLPLALSAMAAVAPANGLAAECGNEAIRKQEQATFLPECRAWELVSPTGQTPEYTRGIPGSREALPHVAGAFASEAGERITYGSLYPTANSETFGEFYLATRNPEAGWSVADAAPPLSTGAEEDLSCYPFVYFSQTLTANVLQAGFAAAKSNEGAILSRKPCARDEPELVPGEPEGVSNIFLRSGESGSAQLVDLVPPGETPENAVFEGGSADLSHVLFGEAAKLVAGAPAGFDLYEWTDGALRLVGYNQQGQAMPGAALADGEGVEVAQGHVIGLTVPPSAAAVTHSVSSDGERVFFTAAGGLYLRENAMQAASASGECSASEPAAACTVQIDSKQGGSEEGGGVFLYASADGSRVFFMDERRLTGDATAKTGEPDLYEYNTEEPEGQRLTDLTVGSTGNRADVQGFVGASEDGAYFYFVADGALTGANGEGVAPVKEQPNLYMADKGTLTFLATLDPATDGRDWAANASGVRYLSSSVSPDGEYLAFDSTRELTKYDNEPVPAEACGSQRRCPEVFLYSAAGGGIACASCNSGAQRPTGPSGLVGEGAFDGSLPAYPQHRLFDDGRLFFESASGLVSEQSNGVPEVYEYRAGAVSLISSGDAEESTLAAVSANGENVFFVTSKSLVAADTGGTPSLYDARVEGGFAAQSAPEVEGEECGSAKTCRAPLGEPPVEAFGASSAFSGPGDLTPAETALQEPKARKPGKKHRLTRRQKLKRALKACGTRHRKKARQRCRRRARTRFDPRRKRGHGHGRGHGHQHRRHRKGRGRQ